MANPESVILHDPNKYVPELNVKLRSRLQASERQSEAPGVPLGLGGATGRLLADPQ